MIRNIKYLMSTCIGAVLIILVLQFYWVKKHYETISYNYERDVNLAFEDAIRKDFIIRADILEKLIVQELLDTTEYSVSSRFDDSLKIWKYTIANKHDQKDSRTFTPQAGEKELLSKAQIARFYAKDIRELDLENHVIFYRTQNLGEFLTKEAILHSFDTTRFKPIFNDFLRTRQINAPYHLKYKENDSSFNRKDFRENSIKTRSFPTHRWADLENKYVYASFHQIKSDVISKIYNVLIGSIMLILLIVTCLYLLFKALYSEKKLTALKNDFISNITHELKTPVAVVVAAIEAISDPDISLDKNQMSKYLQYSKNELSKLSESIEQILNLSFYEEGDLAVNPTKIDYASEIDNIINQTKLLHHKDININVVNNATVKFIYADKKQFYFVINNLLDNAFKYSCETVTITITYKSAGNSINIEIKDDGFGISKDAINRVFDKFYREPRKDHNIKGQGLGLHIVKGIMIAHDGKIFIESKKNKFTKVILVWKV